KKKYIHRDLTAKHILLGENNSIKIAKSGLSILSTEDVNPATHFKISERWAAPEVLTHTFFSIKSDVWAFGIVLYEIVTHGKIPYENLTDEQTKRRVINGYRNSKPPGCEEHLYDIMMDMWNKSPDQRPTFETLQWQLDQYFKLPELERNRIELNKTIGKGKLGEVYDGVYDGIAANGKVRVAVKVLNSDSVELVEAYVMKILQHKHLIQIFGVCTLEKPLYIITKYMKNGNLLDYLKKIRDTVDQLDFHMQVKIAAQVASGMAFIEQNDYVHGDLTARNVLVGENNAIKIAKSGFSRLSSEDINSTTELPVALAAPEIHNHCKYSIQSDVWAFGFLLYQIVTHGNIPYSELTYEQTIIKLKEGFRIPKPPGCEEYLYDIMLHTWKKYPEQRPTFETLQWQLD
ncbi:unnamed protein product, partial [Meganyctiphanes norvegica]